MNINTLDKLEHNIRVPAFSECQLHGIFNCLLQELHNVGNPAVYGNLCVSYIQGTSLQERTRLKLRMRVKASINPLPLL